jgi:hypothetical protein
MKTKKIPHCQKIQESNIKIADRGQIDTLLHKYINVPFLGLAKALQLKVAG